MCIEDGPANLSIPPNGSTASERCHLIQWVVRPAGQGHGITDRRWRSKQTRGLLGATPMKPLATGMVSWAGVPGGTQDTLAGVCCQDGAQIVYASDTLEVNGSVPGRQPRLVASHRGREGSVPEVRGQVDPDRTLVDEAAAGNLDAFDTLVRRYQTRVVNYALAIVRDTGEAEDVAQETFIRAYRSLGRFRGESSFKTWLYTIATNTARTALERRGRRERVGDQSLDDEAQALSAGSVPSGLPDPETMLVTRDAIDRALATLPDDLRVAVVLRDVEGLDYKEIATVTGAPIGTVESRIFRARQRLRVLLRSLRSDKRTGGRTMMETNHAVR